MQHSLSPHLSFCLAALTAVAIASVQASAQTNVLGDGLPVQLVSSAEVAQKLDEALPIALERANALCARLNMTLNGYNAHSPNETEAASWCEKNLYRARILDEKKDGLSFKENTFPLVKLHMSWLEKIENGLVWGAWMSGYIGAVTTAAMSVSADTDNSSPTVISAALTCGSVCFCALSAQALGYYRAHLYRADKGPFNLQDDRKPDYILPILIDELWCE